MLSPNLHKARYVGRHALEQLNMSYLLNLLCLIITIAACNSRIASSRSARVSEGQKRGGDTLYQIRKIDSINSFYVIYAESKQGTVKIVSKKEPGEACVGIKIGTEVLHIASFNMEHSDHDRRCQCISICYPICDKLGI